MFSRGVRCGTHANRCGDAVLGTVETSSIEWVSVMCVGQLGEYPRFRSLPRCRYCGLSSYGIRLRPRSTSICGEGDVLIYLGYGINWGSRLNVSL